jgi:hypothetical protein
MRFFCFTVVLLAASITFAAASADGANGPAIRVTPGGEPWVVTKLRVIDSRAVRGWVGAPVDGSMNSGSWDGKTWEYPMPEAGAGVRYNYLNGDGLHLTFADDAGFNAVVVRGGIKAKLLRDVQKYDHPAGGHLVHTFPGGATTSRAWFDEAVKAKKVSFFDVADGLIADTSFFRVRRGLGELSKADIVPLAATPLAEETAFAAIAVTLDAEGPTTFTISVTDPLNPRLELHGADYTVDKSGTVRIVCDFPDQVVPAGSKVSVTVTPPVKDARFELYRIPKEQAIAEALAHRKHVLHCLYVPVSEARPWNIWNNPGDEQKYFAKPADTGDALQDRLRPFVREIVMTLDQCRALDPEGKDPIVRQFHEWMRRKMLRKSKDGLPPFPTKFARIEGVPEWAALVHQAWMQAREVPKWWVENRLAPNGEFGGAIADDTDMFQNFAPFPMLERDGVGGMLLDAGARMAELCEQLMLTDGMNRESMDPLHAYEEGLNHEALMAYWNYGDPVYLERCMAAARSTEPQTILTAKGHRHFRSDMLGVTEVTKPRPPDREHGAHSLMWHPTFMVAWYNRNPLAMRWLTEWGDGWLEHMRPGEHGVEVKLPEDETDKSDPEAFTGGWGMTGSAFTWLADLSGDARFIRPYNEYFATGKNTGVHLAEIYQMGMLHGGISTLTTAKGSWGAVLYNLANPGPWNAALYSTGDKQPFIAAIKKDIEELQRFPHMYTTLEPFTDRVFLYPIINPSIAYTGGYTTRNKPNLNYAITWDGFGTDYAALVTSATRDHLKVLLCNLSDRPLAGRARLWRLKPGVYDMFFAPDANANDTPDQRKRVAALRVSRGEQVELTLPPKLVHVLEFHQVSLDEPAFDRADLALSPLELKVAGGKVSGVAHNIGLKDVEKVIVSLIDANGKVVQHQSLGPLSAPLDLRPRTVPFAFEGLPEKVDGWSVMLDLQDGVREIYEGNNRLTVGK